MYVNQIDTIIDQILDNLYLQGLSKDKIYQSIIDGKINYVEYREQINTFIQQFTDSLNITDIQKLINNRENMIHIMNIIKRYIAYYYFLSIAYYYTGTIKEYRNNLIQYSKLQESTKFTIKNFFDTENNYQIVNFFKIIKDVSKLIMMTDLERKTINVIQYKDSINFLNSLGREYIDNYLLILTTVTQPDGVTDSNVSINVHNLIKTIVFGEIYKNQERPMVFEILNEVEEGKHEYTYIDIIVTSDDMGDLESFKQIFFGEKNIEAKTKDLYELVVDTNKIQVPISPDTKNIKLLEFEFITPIVDDFLRYHKDSERLENESGKMFSMPLVSSNNANNVKLALLNQQRKKKENTKAQLIINKIDAISEYYSENTKNNPTISEEIKKYFKGPLEYRKTILHNYLDEMRVVSKIIKQGRRAIEGNEYFRELQDIIKRAYFNFNDFKQYGVTINLDQEKPLTLLRYSNVEYKGQMSRLDIDVRSDVNNQINLVGLSLGPFGNNILKCTKKEDMVDIRTIKLTYIKNGKKVTKTSENGFKMFNKIIKYFYINAIRVKEKSTFSMYYDFSEMEKLNPHLFSKIIYWIYDIEKDSYKMDTYENLKSYNFQQVVQYMNVIIYDKIVTLLTAKLSDLVIEHIRLSIVKIDDFIDAYSSFSQLSIKPNEKRDIIIKDYIKNKLPDTPEIPKIPDSERIEPPEYITIPESPIFIVKIDAKNPLHLRKYSKIDLYSSESQKSLDFSSDIKCQHENEWNEIMKLQKQNINRYNTEIIQFMEKFVIETDNTLFICRVCGQVLPMKQYVQDGKFDNNTQKFITAYVPLDVPLYELKEYAKYKFIINFLDHLVTRMSLITGTNMLSGPNPNTKQRRKGVVKNIIDLILKHNYVNLKKNQNENDRLDFMAKKFNIEKEIDSVFYFELDDSIKNFSSVTSASVPTIESDVNKLKINNILLYVFLIFITELNGSQISTMAFDKIGNIYVYLKYGPKLFQNLLIKKNLTDMETEKITKYPVLCYLIFIIAYFLIKFKLWAYSSSSTSSFNLVYQKAIINSIVDLFNSISMDAGKLPNDYIYMLTTSKLYSQLNTTFKNNQIIEMLKRAHLKYSSKDIIENVTVVKENTPIIYRIDNLPDIIRHPQKIISYKVSSGTQFDLKQNILYHDTKNITDITNCPFGSYHKWQSVGTDVICSICGENIETVQEEISRLNETYYYNLANIAVRRCIIGSVHDFVQSKGDFICNICHRSAKEKYTHKELDELSLNLRKNEDNHTQQIENKKSELKKFEETRDFQIQELYEKLIETYNIDNDNKQTGQTSVIINKLVQILDSIIGKNVVLSIDTYPVYLSDDVYIINHTFNGQILNKPYEFNQSANKVLFRQNNPFFKTDVYYYTDNSTQKDVFYHAVSLKLIGYKEKHKDYVNVSSNVYLEISPSIKKRFLLLGYDTKYIDISTILGPKYQMNDSDNIIDISNEIYWNILNNLIKDHIIKTRTIIDKFSSIIYRMKNYQPQDSIHLTDPSFAYMQSVQSLDKLINKHAELMKNIKLGKNGRAFDEWNELRTLFEYNTIDWEKTNIRPSGSIYVDSEIINHYDISSNIMSYYLVSELIDILDNNKDTSIKLKIANMYIEIISYIYKLYNIDKYKNLIDIKRFEYILNGSEMMTDVFKKGQGLTESKIIEEQLDDTNQDMDDIVNLSDDQKDEMDDLREEAEALDIDADYYAEEDEDTAQVGDYEDQ